MLATLKIRDLVLIEDVSLDFAPGLNVLTGETGAGKSILLDALGLAAGARAGARSSVRTGASQGSSVAIFDLDKKHAAVALLKTNDIPFDGDVILRRAITVDGRTRAFVNDEPVGVGLLRDLGGMLVEIHGQSDDRGLFDNATHRRVLDAFGQNEKLVDEVAARFSAFEQARNRLAELRKAAAAAAADADFIRHAAGELSDLAPEEGEESRLAGERALLMNAGKIAEDIAAATELLGGDRSAESSLAGAIKRLSRMNEEARKAAAGAIAALEQAFAQTEDARQDLENLLSRLDADSSELERKEDRLFALRAAARKYAVQPDELPRVMAEFVAKLDSISGDGAGLKAAEAETVKARGTFLDSAGKLSAARKTAARKLEGTVVSELLPLKLAHAKFRVALDPLSEDAATSHGLERVAFEVATIEGAPFGPLAKIASGGELARFGLALKVALSEASPPAALVFDEVDRGVGGAVADAVGLNACSALAEIHAGSAGDPQRRRWRHAGSAAFPHFAHRRSRPASRSCWKMTPALEEIARMLSGATVTDEARAAAKRRLMAEAAVRAEERRGNVHERGLIQ